MAKKKEEKKEEVKKEKEVTLPEVKKGFDPDLPLKKQREYL